MPPVYAVSSVALQISRCGTGGPGGHHHNGGGTDWVSLALSLVAIGLTVLTIWLAVLRDTRITESEKAATFLLLQRALIEPDQAKGRDVLYTVQSEEVFARMRGNDADSDDRKRWEMAGRALANLDVLALHAKMGRVDKELVIDQWTVALQRIRPGYDAYLKTRVDDGDRVWPNLRWLMGEVN